MSATVEKMPNAVAELRHQLGGMEDQFKAALPAHIPVERFARIVMTAVQNNPELIECDRRSLWNSAMKAAQDGLLPDGREGAMVVRRDKKSPTGKSVNWQPMIAGIRKKARNSGEIATWDAHEVCENDAFEFELGDEPFIRHKPALDNRGKIIAAYSICTLKSGEKTREVMGIGEMHAIRDRSDAWKAFKAGYIKSTPWSTDEGEMCRKTVARRHSKVIPTSTDLDDLIRRDDELYELSGAKEEARLANGGKPQSLAGKLDALVGGGKQPAAEAEILDSGDVIEGEATEPHGTELDQTVDESVETFLDLARSKSLEGRRVFDAWVNEITPEQKAEIQDHMSSLMKAAKTADGRG
jgi:recombination protein RecT